MACADTETKTFDAQILKDNKFKNTELQQIYNFQNDRNSASLISYFKHQNPLYRETAVLSFASVQDSSTLVKLLGVLETDKSEKVRIAAAFAIGQTGDSLVMNELITKFNDEISAKVLASIAEAIGKCGSASGLDFLVTKLDREPDKIIINGLLSGIYRYTLRGFFSDTALEKILEIINDSKSGKDIQYSASLCLTRIKNFNLNSHFTDLEKAFQHEDIFTKLNIISALSNANSDNSAEFLEKVVSNSSNYLLKINAIKSLYGYDYEKVSGSVFSALTDSNVNVGIQASEYFVSNGTEGDANKYLSLSKKIKNWRIRVNLLTAAIKFAKEPKDFTPTILSIYKSSENAYEKANLLKSLSSDLSSYQFVRNEVRDAKEFVIKTYGMEALAEMRRDSGFNLFNDQWQKIHQLDLVQEFAMIFKEAVLSGDPALVSIAAEIIRDPMLNFRTQYKNSYFLTQAINKCKLPNELEAFQELQKTIAYIDGKKIPDYSALQNKPIDWDYVINIAHNQLVEIATSKGNILLALDVNKAPVSVANFLKLAENGFYNDKHIHRVVPNFVVQDGCPRGDGWGGPDYTICSEFAHNYYDEGSLGMASAGKDTESSQWFITHSPTPHLDGRYTNFGKVVKGMEVVHLLEVGDVIITIKRVE